MYNSINSVSSASSITRSSSFHKEVRFSSVDKPPTNNSDNTPTTGFDEFVKTDLTTTDNDNNAPAPVPDPAPGNSFLVLTESMIKTTEQTESRTDTQYNSKQEHAQPVEIKQIPKRREIKSATTYSKDHIHNEYSLSEDDETKVKETIESNKANIKCSKKTVENGDRLHCIGQLIGRSFALQQNESFLNKLGQEYSIEVDKLKQAIKDAKSSLKSIWEQEPDPKPALKALINTIKAEKNIDINIDSLKRLLSSHRKNTVIKDGLTNTANHIQKHFDNLGNNTIEGYKILYDESHNGYCILTPQNEKIGIKPQSIDENGKITWQMATYINDINIQDELNNAKENNITQLKNNPFYSGDKNSISIESAFLVFTTPDEILEDTLKSKTNLLNNMSTDQLVELRNKLVQKEKDCTIYCYLSKEQCENFIRQNQKTVLDDINKYMFNYKNKFNGLNQNINNDASKIKNKLQKCWHIINRLEKYGQETSYLARLAKILTKLSIESKNITEQDQENLEIVNNLLKDLKEKNKQLKTH